MDKYIVTFTECGIKFTSEPCDSLDASHVAGTLREKRVAVKNSDISVEEVKEKEGES